MTPTSSNPTANIAIGCDALLARRKTVFALPANNPPGASTAKSNPEELDEPWGLALSGGGIRSATYSLGVVQGLALAPIAPPPGPVGAGGSRYELGFAPPAKGQSYSNSLLARFDYLSTVSGGGYLGSFVASLFLRNRLIPGSKPSAGEDAAKASLEASRAADAAIETLKADPPGRIRASEFAKRPNARTFPLAWLRENGRYLTPTGAGDMAYAASLDLRNWVAVHYVIGTIVATIFAALAFARGWWSYWTHDLDTGIPAMPATAIDACSHLCKTESVQLWWSPFLELAALPAMLWALPVGLAFWFSYPTTRKGAASVESDIPLSIIAAAGICIALFALGCVQIATSGHTADAWANTASYREHLGFGTVLSIDEHGLSRSFRALRDAVLAEEPTAVLWLGGAFVVAFSIGYYYVGRALCGGGQTEPEVARQRVLFTRWLRSALTFTLAILILGTIDTAGQTLYLFTTWNNGSTGFVVPGGLAVAITWLAKKIAPLLSGPSKGGWLSRVPLSMLAGIAGFVVLFSVAVLWSFAVAWVVWDGQAPTQTADGTLWARSLLLLGLLILAGITGQFPGFINLSSLQSFYSARLARAYLGASNRERFENTDDKALSAAEPVPGDDLPVDSYCLGNQPTSLAPLHIINVTVNKTIDPAEQLVQRDRKGQPMAVLPMGFAIDGHMYGYRPDEGRQEIQKNLSVGKWVGTSGAAVSTGIGRQTSLGLSLLLGAANVRLGTWWESGAKDGPQRESPIAFVLRTQAYLLDELTARFFGLARKWQYLSDGGHFENTAAYELLRPERRTKLIFIVDAGADPDYNFGDLANLIRLARIDHKAEIGIETPKAGSRLSEIFGTPEEFKRKAAKEGEGPAPRGTKCAVLLSAKIPGQSLCWMVLIKPTVLKNSPQDVQQYADAHPAFPQEPTADQFFDEAQWESYRKLALSNMELLMDPAIRAELAAVTGCSVDRAN